MFIGEPIQEMDEISDNWDRSDHSRCDPCWISINQAGQPQCMDCLAWFGWHGGSKEMMLKCLQEMHGGEWEEEYRKLREVRRLVLSGQYHKLHATRCTYHLDDGTIKTAYGFYELKR